MIHPVLATFLQDQNFLDVLYIVAFGLFIQGLRGLSGPTTAVRGNRIAAVGMAIAVIATLLNPGEGNWGLIVLGIALGVAVGVPAARQVKMTAMPQMVALFNGVGGGAVFLISWAEFRNYGSSYSGVSTYIAVFSVFAAIVGSVSFWGSNIAFGKLQEIIPGRPISFGSAQQIVNLVLLILAVAAGVDLIAGAHSQALFIGDAHGRRAVGQRGRAADRRRRHAGGDLAAERVHRPVRGGDRHRAEQHRADRRGHDRRRLGLDPHEPDGGRHEPLDPGDHRRRVRRRWSRRGRRPEPASTPARCARPAPPTPRSSSPTPAAW